jgi:hypothetical protein
LHGRATGRGAYRADRPRGAGRNVIGVLLATYHEPPGGGAIA